MYPFLCAAILGIVEGLTEFLPVSSTAHLVLAGQLLGFTGDSAETFEVFIQAGAILAVLLLYHGRFERLVPGSAPAADGMSGFPGLVKIAVACAPAFVLGFLLRDFIKDNLFHPAPIAIALILGGIVMIAIELRKPAPRVTRIEEISVRDAFIIGLAQCVALCPGVSRSGSTIVGGLLAGLGRRAAAEFSFLVAVPVMFAAVGYDLYKSFAHLQASDIPVFALGFAVAFVTAVAAIRFFMAIISRFSFAPFGIYRIIAGILVLTFIR